MEQRRCPLQICKDSALSLEPWDGEFLGLVRTNRDMRFFVVKDETKPESESQVAGQLH